MFQPSISESVRNSQAVRDWIRASDDLERARDRGAPPTTLRELEQVRQRARDRVMALERRVG